MNLLLSQQCRQKNLHNYIKNHYELLLRDDGEGNLYDNAFSASFAAYKSGSSDGTIAPFTVTGSATRGSGSQIGNAFYEQGLIVITDTGTDRDWETGRKSVVI